MLFPCQCDAQLCHIGGRNAGDAPRLPQIAGTDAGKLFPGFQRQAGEGGVLEILRDEGLFVACHLPDHPVLSGDVTGVLDLGLQSLRQHGGDLLSPADDARHQRVADLGTAQQLLGNAALGGGGKTGGFHGGAQVCGAQMRFVQAAALGFQNLLGVLVLCPAVILHKAVKTEAEQVNIRAAHVKDGVAVCRFLYWLKTCVGYEEITERSAAAKLESFRAEQADYLGASFDPIAAYGAHAAIVHYDPAQQAEETYLAPRGLCLFDTGGHYLQGTTDITRTVALGPVTADERRLFTLVLRGHLRLSQARFPQGTVGQDLDILARQPLWERGLDFLHGTGHGVGYVLSVHEGPQRLHWRFTPGSAPCALQAGMVISNEPGYYQAGAFGIRHENLLLVRPSCETEYGAFLRFENLTMVPFDRDAIDPALLTAEERAALNRYHRAVWETISPHLAGDERAWLKAATEAL